MPKNNSRSARPLLLERLALLLALACVVSAHAAPFQPSRFMVVVEGEGPDVIMIPGLASSSAVWKPEVEKLKSHYRLHLIQVAGFGGTDVGANSSAPILAPIVEEINLYITANGLKKPSIIGHSLGGLLGLMLVEKHPESADKLMIVDSLPFYGMVFGPTATVESIAPQAARMRDSILGGTQAAYAASEPSVMIRLVKSKGSEAQQAVADAVASDHSVVALAMYEDFTTDLRPSLPNIKTPIVLLYPFDSTAGMPQAMVDGLYQGAYATLPNKKLVRIDNSFHFIQIDQPEAFDHEVQAFLSTP